MKPHLIFVAGKDPLEDSSGHGSYVRMWTRAAVAAGYWPEIFCMSKQKGDAETPYGRVHRIRSPWRKICSNRHTGILTYTAGWHIGILACAVAEFAQQLDPSEPLILHGVQSWTAAAVRVAKRLRSEGRNVTLIMSAYTTIAHEFNERWRGARALPGMGRTLSMAWEMINLHLFLNRCERLACRGVDRIVVHYESVRRLVEAAWAPCATVVCLPYTSERAMINPPEPESKADGVPMILAVSRHDSRKGLDTLLRALALLKQRGVQFRACLVGGGVCLSVHRQLASHLGLDGAVEITGYVQDTAPHWQAASVFVLPSHQEGSGSMSLLEALERGKAIVASGIDGIPEDVEDGRSGLLVPAKNPEALAGALRRVLENEHLRHELERGARQRFEQQFAPARLVSAIAGLYNS